MSLLAATQIPKPADLIHNSPQCLVLAHTLKNERLTKTAKPWKRPGCSMKASAAAGKKTWLR